MKFNCQQQALTKALNIVSKAISSKNTIPILKGILLKVSPEGMLTLAASDLDLSIENKLPVSSYEEGAVVVSARLFGDIIRKLPPEEVTVEAEDGANVKISCLASEFSIVGQPADEFPSMGEIKKEQTLLLEKELLKSMIRKTAFSASIEESKGIITGILTEIEEEKITMVALDGFRMAIARENVKNKEKKKIIISARIMGEINKILSELEEDEEITLYLDEKKAVVIAEDTKMMLRLLEGEFIKYKDILPKEYGTRIKAVRGELLNSIERASLLAREGKNNLIKLALEEDRMVITSRSEEGNVREEVFVEKEGPSLEIGFNSKYIMDVMKAVSDEEIAMEFNSSVSPCLIKPVSGEQFEYLVLPVRISSN
ncbi:MAG: DNA polymerase III subunit beta [Bacillota bacterium]|nr:DNA polymerase III subunit beta [Bacillota bacterium]